MIDREIDTKILTTEERERESPHIPVNAWL